MLRNEFLQLLPCHSDRYAGSFRQSFDGCETIRKSRFNDGLHDVFRFRGCQDLQSSAGFFIDDLSLS